MDLLATRLALKKKKMFAWLSPVRSQSPLVCHYSARAGAVGAWVRLRTDFMVGKWLLDSRSGLEISQNAKRPLTDEPELVSLYQNLVKFAAMLKCLTHDKETHLFITFLVFGVRITLKIRILNDKTWF